MIISPTEPARLRELGHVGMLPEEYGADILIVPHPSWEGHVGVQRKEVSDLLASITDGRLGEQLLKMRSLALGVLLIEGRARWTNDGEMIVRRGRGITRDGLRGLLWTARKLGVWVDWSDSIPDTIAYLAALEKWLQKEHHASFDTRPGPVKSDPWGQVTNEDWQLHLLKTLPGVGPVAAKRILASLGMPLAMNATRAQLLAVEGLGPAKVDRILAAVPSLEGAT